MHSGEGANSYSRSAASVGLVFYDRALYGHAFYYRKDTKNKSRCGA